MQRDIDLMGCEFRCDYEWDAEYLVLEGISIAENDVTDILSDTAVEKIEAKLYEYFHEDRAERAEYNYEMRRYA